MEARPLLAACLAGLAASAVLGIAAAMGQAEGPAWPEAHASIAVFAFTMPGLAFLHWHVAGPLMPRRLAEATPVALAWLLGGFLLAVGTLAPLSIGPVASGLAGLILLAAAVLQAKAVLGAAPRRGESVVDVARDPLTKGDDASLKHVRFAHMVFLPLAALGIAATTLPVAGLLGDGWVQPLRLASYHWLLAGYGLLSVYGLSHIAIPRLSGVPAIAAGAIKGELHSSLLGLLLLGAGFLVPAGTAATALLVSGGVFVFLGAFVFMGVLGANIMKNKSPTQRVTPEFAYVPWIFTGVFWLIAGVLLGVFLNAARARFPELMASLTFIHVHAALLGGFAILLLGLATRLLPAARGLPPAPFRHTKWSLYGLNVSLALLGYGRLAQDQGYLVGGSVLATLSVAAWFISLLPSLRAPQ